MFGRLLIHLMGEGRQNFAAAIAGGFGLRDAVELWQRCRPGWDHESAVSDQFC